VPHHGEVVRDEQVRQLELVLQRLEQVDDLRLDRDVECRHGLVRGDEVRIQRQGPREADPLPLAAGELMRIAGDCVRGQPDDLQELAHAGGGRPSSREPVHAQRLADDPADAVARVQRRERVLEDHLHPSAEGAEIAFLQVRYVLPVEEDAAVRRLVEPQDRAPERRLAAARLADEAEGLPALDRERDVVDGLDVPDVAVEHDPALDREVDLEVLDLY
jgi:hypothetical protein